MIHHDETAVDVAITPRAVCDSVDAVGLWERVIQLAVGRIDLESPPCLIAPPKLILGEGDSSVTTLVCRDHRSLGHHDGFLGRTTLHAR